MTGTLLSIGHGYSAQALERRLLPLGWRIIGTTRSEEKADAMRQRGVEPLIWPGNALPLDEATHLLSSVSPGDDGDPVLAEAGKAIADADLDWCGYLSTTSVYGDHNGAWVDEDTPPAPTTERGHQRVAAENAWADTGHPLHVFRLAGIYGPGRGPFAKIRRGTARRIIKPGQVFSRIHVEDIGAALFAAINAPHPGVYNLCDDDPAPPQDVLLYAAELIGAPPPPEVHFDDADLSDMARSFYSETKRVRNDRIKQTFDFRLAYPDYRSGLAQIAAVEA